MEGPFAPLGIAIVLVGLGLLGSWLVWRWLLAESGRIKAAAIGWARPLPDRSKVRLPSWLAPGAQAPVSLPPVGSGEFHLSEWVAEPSASINSSTVDVWIYRVDRQPQPHAVVIAGHANGNVCRQVSALVANTIMSQPPELEPLSLPGAGLLESEAATSELILASKGRRQARRRQRPMLGTDLGTLPVELGRIAEASGMVCLHDLPDWGISPQVEAWRALIASHYDPERGILLRLAANSDRAAAFFMPFPRLADSDQVPVTFDIPLSMLEGEEFSRLQDYHRRAYDLEMTAEARRRRRIYQEWLRGDEHTLNLVKARFEHMSEEERDAKSVSIGLQRDYVGATTVAVDEEHYISPRENVDRNLPGLIREDKRWIKMMDDIIGQIEQRRQRGDPRQDALNLATLVDSFLRGWPSVFLADAEVRAVYDRWCTDRRQATWQAIQAQLKEQGIKIDPLLEEDTIFQAEQVGDWLRVTPLHLLDAGQPQLVFLSPRHGIPWYISTWQRRQPVLAPEPASLRSLRPNLSEARRLCATAAEHATVGDHEKALADFRLALSFHPPAAARFIYEQWWSHYARDTGAEFELYAQGARGFQAFFRGHHAEAQEHLEAFVRRAPGYVADAHLILSLANAYERTGFAQLVEMQRELVESHGDKVDEHNRKLEFLRSNQPLIDRVLRQATVGPFGFPSMGEREGIAIPTRNLTGNEQRLLREIERISAEVSSLRKELDRAKSKAEDLDRRIQKAQTEAWNRLGAGDDPHIEAARQLDPKWVDELVSKREFSASQAFWLRMHPIIEVLQGHEYVQLAEKLGELGGKLKANTISHAALTREVASVRQPTYLEPDKLSALGEFEERLGSTRAMDVLTRNLIWRKELEEIAQNLFHEGMGLLDRSARLVPCFVEPAKIRTKLLAQYRLQYRESLEMLVSAKVALRNLAPGGSFHVLDGSDFRPKALRVDPGESRILATNEDGEEVVLLRYEGLTLEEHQHLEACLSEPALVEQFAIGLSAAERLLNTLLPPTPASARWSSILDDLRPWLIKTLAFAGVLPVPDPSPLSDQVLDRFEGQVVRSEPVVDLQAMAADFMTQHEPGGTILDASVQGLASP